jgi:hypothetical protein
MSDEKSRPLSPIAIQSHRPPKSVSELEGQVAAWALAHGEDPAGALRELRRPTALARLIYRVFGVDRPRKKPGPKPKPGLDALVIAIAHDLDRKGTKGSANWTEVHSHLDNQEGLMGELLSVAPSAIEQVACLLKSGPP